MIRAGSGLSESEIQQMVQDAAANADADKKFHELVMARNQADALIHSARKSLTDLKGKISEEEASNVESAIKDLEEVIKGDDRSIIEEKTKVLSDASAKIAEKLYAEQANTAGNSNSQDGGQKDDAVDAEFEEVKDKDSK